MSIYIEWFIKAVAQVLFMAVCYVTNPIVVLFADVKGNLPVWLSWWQTYDNCLDVGWMISEDVVPRWMQYDFDKHYVYHYESKGDGYMIPGYVDVLDAGFTAKEKVQRYFCRLAWLYRNTGYGFAYYVLGKDYLFSFLDEYTDIQDDADRKVVAYTSNAFCYYLEKKWCKWFYIRIYAGWKLKGCYKYEHVNRAMIACHINPFRKNKG